MEEQPPHGCCGVDVMLIEVEVDAGGLEVLDGAQQINRGPTQPIGSPGHNQIELAPTGVVQHAIQPWALAPALGAADADVPCWEGPQDPRQRTVSLLRRELSGCAKSRPVQCSEGVT